MANAAYAAVGSTVLKGQVALQEGDPYDVIVIRLALNPLDTDSDDVLTIDVVCAREDVDRLVEALIAGAAEVPYLSEQVITTTEEAN